MGVALLEVAAAAAPHQQGVATEGQAVVVEYKAETAIGVPRCGAHLQGPLSEGHPITVLQGQAHVFRPDAGGQTDGAAGGGVHQPAARHVVGVGMGVEAGQQLDAQFADQGEIAVVLLENRIDQQALAAADIGE